MKNDPPVEEAVEKDAARRNESAIRELREQIAALQKQNAEIKAAIDAMTKVIMGNGGPGLGQALLDMQGVREMLDSLSAVVEGMGRLFEQLHRQGQEKDTLLSGVIDQVSMAQAWREVAQMWQVLFTTQRQAIERL
jgi:hypothetical protein